MILVNMIIIIVHGADGQSPAVVFNQEVRMKVCGSVSCLLSEDQPQISNRDKNRTCCSGTFIISVLAHLDPALSG